MTPVNLGKWPRKAVFELYRDFEYPQINVSNSIDKFKSLSRKDLFPFLTYPSVFDIPSLNVNVFLAFYHPKLNFKILTVSNCRIGS